MSKLGLTTVFIFLFLSSIGTISAYENSTEISCLPGSAYIISSDIDWNITRDATTGTVTPGQMYSGSREQAGTYSILRNFLMFDTSTLPAGITISATNLSVYVDGKSNGDNDGTDFITVVNSTQASSSTLVAGDFDQIGTEGIAASSRLDITSITTSAWNNFIFSAPGLGFIDETGYTTIALLEGHDHLNETIVNGTYNNIYTTIPSHANRPKLSITFNETPPTPTHIAPANASEQISATVTLSASVPDDGVNEITYYYYGGSSEAGMLFLGTNDTSVSTYDWTVSSPDTTATYYWTCFAGDLYGNSSNMSTSTFTLMVPPTLISPANYTTLYTTFPPLIDSVSFTWQDVSAPQYRLVIAEDADFNVVTIDTVVSATTSSQDLMVNKQYWWRVYSYDGATYSSASDYFTFNWTANTSLSGSAIEGVAYTDVDGTYTVLSGVEISIWNSTWADFAITASNGYYKFENLAPTSVYSMQAKKDRYDDTAISLISTTTDPVIKNFYMIVDRTTEEWWHYVKFTVWSLRGYHDDVLVNVYTGDATTITYTGFTGENVDGSITFVLDRQQEYTLTFVNATQGINETLTLYPKDDSYLIFVAFPSSWDEYETPVNEAIDIDVSTSIINSTAACVNVSYTDSLNETTSATVYLNQSNQSDPYNQTVVGSQSRLSGNWTHSFIVTDYHGESYYVHVIANHTTFGTVDKTYAVTFDDSVVFDGIPDKFWLYLSLFIMLFTGAMFTATTVQQGSMVLCIEGWVFLALGWFDTADPTLIGVGLGFATVFAIIANINKKTKKEGIE